MTMTDLICRVENTTGRMTLNRPDALNALNGQLLGEFAKALKSAGFRFVGSTIIYAFIQGIGMVDDHVAGCWCRAGKGRSSPAAD